jgi:hypothetical protein
MHHRVLERAPATIAAHTVLLFMLAVHAAFLFSLCASESNPESRESAPQTLYISIPDQVPKEPLTVRKHPGFRLQ